MNPTKEAIYPGIPERIKAALVDGAILFGMTLIVTGALSAFEDVPKIARILAFVFIFILYEPTFISLLGGTIGHFAIGLRVRHVVRQEKKIIFPLAVLRWLCKALLGWLSLLTVTGNERKLAVHDMASGSIVLYKNR